MTKAQAAALIIGLVIPFLITILKQAKFPRWLNLIISIITCGAAGVLIVYANGSLSFTPANILITIGLIFVSAQATYAGFWKDSPLENKLNLATSILKPATPTTGSTADTR